MIGHTPGPWWPVLNAHSRYEIHYAGGHLAGVSKWDDPASPPPIPEMNANANLIATAPDLLGSLKDMRSFAYRRGDLIHQSDMDRCMCAKCIEARADAAIAKATGATP